MGTAQHKGGTGEEAEEAWCRGAGSEMTGDQGRGGATRGSGAAECEKVHGTGKGLVWRWQACVLLLTLPEPLRPLPVLKSNPLKSPSLPKVHACSAASVRSDSLLPFELTPTRLLCPWDFPGKNPGVGCHALLQGIFLTQGMFLHCRWILYG